MAEPKISVDSHMDPNEKHRIIVITLPVGVPIPEESWDTETLIARALAKIEDLILWTDFPTSTNRVVMVKDLEDIRDNLVYALR